MSYKSVMQQDYDNRIKFHGNALLCYSKKKFKEIGRTHSLPVIGEITGKKGEEGEPVVGIHGTEYTVFPAGKKSRVLYREAGYLCLEDGNCLAVLESRLPLFLLLLLLAAALGGILWFFFLRQPTVPVVTPPPVDSNVGVIEDDSTEKMEAEEGGGAVRLTYSLDAELDLATGQIEMYFLNPNASTHSISLVLYLTNGEEEIKIAESGMIQPGYGLTEMQFLENAAVLSPGTYEGRYLVYIFDSGTGEKAIVETSVPGVVLEVA